MSATEGRTPEPVASSLVGVLLAFPTELRAALRIQLSRGVSPLDKIERVVGYPMSGTRERATLVVVRAAQLGEAPEVLAALADRTLEALVARDHVATGYRGGRETASQPGRGLGVLAIATVVIEVGASPVMKGRAAVLETARTILPHTPERVVSFASAWIPEDDHHGFDDATLVKVFPELAD